MRLRCALEPVSAYAVPIFLCDGAATKVGILEALEATGRNMARGGGQDMAVVMFSGHGAVMDGQFYLVSHGVDNGKLPLLRRPSRKGKHWRRNR